ncbi:MAG TPA: cupin domain-containing protein [Chthoniobacterales bacterium]|jgi:uncharacterized cupin superfamily protein
MRKVNLKDIPETSWRRKALTKNFGSSAKHISQALGREPASFDLVKRHPFDLAFYTIPKGKSLCPYHSHSAESELYLIVSGQGRVRDKDGVTDVGPGDAFFFGPGQAHQLSSIGEEDLVYYIIADNPLGDSCYYPDSGKWSVWKEGSEEVIVKGREADYFEGED